MNINDLPKHPMFYPLMIAAVSVLFALPIIFWGIPSGNDLPQHYQFAAEFGEGIRNGQLHPGWAGEPNSGFGDVGVRFYPPLAYYPLTFFAAVTGSWWIATFLSVSIWFFVGGLGVFYWAREWFSEKAALFGALVYIILPYHVNQIYNAFFYAEFAAAAILPFCFLFAARLARAPGGTNIAGLSTFYALLILTHLPTALFGSFALLVYSLASLPKTERKQTIKAFGSAAALGLAASGFYWIRMVSELGYLKHAGSEFISAAYDFHINFLGSYPVVAEADYYGRSLWFVDLMFGATLAMVIPAAVLHFAARKDGAPTKFGGLWALLAAAVFFATPLSLPIWENIAILQRVQFPFRLLGLIGLAAAIIAAAGAAGAGRSLRPGSRPIALLLYGMFAAALVFSAAQIIRPAIYIDRTEFAARMQTAGAAKSCECWWPVWANAEALKSTERVNAGGRAVEIRRWGPEKRRFRVAAGEKTMARIATFYYPRWRATVNGHAAEVERDADGAIMIHLPPDAADVRLIFEESWITEAARGGSAFAWLFIFWASVWKMRNGNANGAA